jgi:hypothetical protein
MALTRAAAAGSLLLLATTLAPVGARAQTQSPAGQSPAALQEPALSHDHPSLLDRPHTVAQFEAGIIALPSAPISGANQGGATPIGRVGSGDATLQTGMHLVYRATREWAIGAGALLSPVPTSDTNYGVGGLKRTHSRSYLLLLAEGAYFPFRTRWFEAFLGATVGGVIVGDRFTTPDAPPVPSILGTNTTTVSSEGFASGVQLGADYLLTDQWVLGIVMRGDLWVLPQFQSSSQTTCDPILDCPTLKGLVVAFEVGLSVGYRIPL